MTFVVLKENETIAALAKRVFRPKTKAEQASAEAAILRANPDLRDSANLKAGLPIRVPEAAATSSGGTDVAAVVSGLLKTAREIVGDLNPVISSGLDQQEKDVRVTLELVKSPDVQKLAERIPELKQRLPDAAKRADQQLSDIAAVRAHQKDAVAEFDRDISALAKGFQ